MKKLAIIVFASLLIFSCNKDVEKDEVKPNIIYFLADDLGYGEIGINGQDKIQTPNIDALASNGMLFKTL